MTRLRAVGRLAILSLAASCLSAPTESAPATVIVRGSWSYVSVQSGGPTTASGTLTLSQDSTVRFTGTLDANEQDTQGLLRRIAGVVSGHTIDASLIEFDMVIDPQTNRRHTGAVRGDSLTGSWIQISDAAGGIAASGTFRAHRIR
jgi:hypothetical protein